MAELKKLSTAKPEILKVEVFHRLPQALSVSAYVGMGATLGSFLAAGCLVPMIMIVVLFVLALFGIINL